MTKESNDQQMEDVIETRQQDVPVDTADENRQDVEIDAETLAQAAQNAGLTDSEPIEQISTEADEVTDDLEDFDQAADEDLDEGDDEAIRINSIAADDGTEVTVESVVEAILFASDEPITPNRLVSIVETGSVKQIKDCVKSLNEKYKENNSSFRIEQIAGGFQMMTLDAYNHCL